MRLPGRKRRTEARRFLNEVLGLCLSGADVAALADRTKGWVVDWQLAGLAVREQADPSQFIAALGGSHRFILSYLVEQVLDRQDEEIARFLLQMSILNKLNGELCAAVTGRADSSALLESLLRNFRRWTVADRMNRMDRIGRPARRFLRFQHGLQAPGILFSNLFLVALDERCWYRYHHLFADLLANRQSPATIEFITSSYGEANTMNGRVLVAYASQHGSTAGVADAIGKQLAGAGATVDVRRVQEVADLSPYRAAVVGSAVHSGRWLPEAMEFVQAYQGELNRMPTAIFLVCGMLASSTTPYRSRVADWLQPARALVRPVAEGLFAGAILFKNYRFLESLGMRIFAASIKIDEGDYRDWTAIRAWTDSIRPLLRIGAGALRTGQAS